MATADGGNSAVVDALALGQIERASLLLSEGSPLDLQRAAEVVIDKGQYECLKFLLSKYRLDCVFLHRALVVQQEDIARLLIKSGVNANSYKKTRSSYCGYEIEGCEHYSCYLPLQLSLFCSFDMMRFLLGFHADINKQNHSGETPLIFACRASVSADRVAFLLENGAKVHTKDRNRATALHWAVRMGNIETVTLLTDYEADIEAKDAYGNTPLMWACRNSQVLDCLKFLLAKGASCHSKNIYEETGFHEAAKSGNAMALKLLIQYGAHLEARTLNGDTALILACGESVRAECVRILLENGAFPNVKKKSMRVQPKLATETRNKEEIKMPLQYGTNAEDTTVQEGTDDLRLACRKPRNVRSVLKLQDNNHLPKTENQRGRTALHIATVTGDIEALKALVQYQADVNAVTDKNETPLMLACAKTSVDKKCVKFLLENKALPNVTNMLGGTALHKAVLSRDIDKVKILVKYGADVNAMDINKKTPLMLACALNVEYVKFLLENKALPNVTDCMDQTPLHSVIAAGNIQHVKVLVEYGADVNAKDGYDQTPLMLACAQNFANVECVKYLLQSKAMPNLADVRGETAFHMAAFAGDVEKLKVLIQYGIDVNRTDGSKKTPLMLVCDKKSVNVKCAEFLLENKALPNMADIRDDTALHIAVAAENNLHVKLLVQNGADTNVRDGNKKTPLILACAVNSPNVECVKFLLENKALPNLTDCMDQTALHFVAIAGNIELMQLLVRYGADVNVANRDKQTPLMLACALSVECVQFLLENKALPNVRDWLGQTALHYSLLPSQTDVRETGATWCNSSEIVRLLVEHGAEIEARRSTGETPFLIAVQTRRHQLIKLLYTLGADVSAEDTWGQNAVTFVMKTAQEENECHDQKLLQWLIDKGVSVNHRDKNGWTPLMLAAKYKHMVILKYLLDIGADVHAVGTAKTWIGTKKITALSIWLEEAGWDIVLDCAEELMRYGAVNSLPERFNDVLHEQIKYDKRVMIHLLLTNGLAPTMSPPIFGPFSTLSDALDRGNIPVIQYLLGNLMLCPCDIYGHSYFSHWRPKLISKNKTDVVTMMNEFYSQPKTLFQLSFVTVSHALGGVPGRVDRVNSLPLPSIVKDKLLFKSIDVPMDLRKN